MRIPVGDKYVLTSDAHNIVVNKLSVDEKTGEKYTRPETYHITLRDAIRSLFERDVRRSDAETVAELAEHIEKLKADILAAIPAMKTEFLRQEGLTK